MVFDRTAHATINIASVTLTYPDKLAPFSALGSGRKRRILKMGRNTDQRNISLQNLRKAEILLSKRHIPTQNSHEYMSFAGGPNINLQLSS
jgi:hypothetical protein